MNDSVYTEDLYLVTNVDSYNDNIKQLVDSYKTLGWNTDHIGPYMKTFAPNDSARECGMIRRGYLISNLRLSDGSYNHRVPVPDGYAPENILPARSIIACEQKSTALDILNEMQNIADYNGLSAQFRLAEIPCEMLVDTKRPKNRRRHRELYVVFDYQLYSRMKGFDITGLIDLEQTPAGAEYIYKLYVTADVTDLRESYASNFIAMRDSLKKGKVPAEQAERLHEAEDWYFDHREEVLSQITFDPESAWYTKNHLIFQNDLYFAAYDLLKDRLEKHPKWMFH